MRRLATIRLVDEVFPIENADRLEQVAIGGWRVVTGKGEFKKEIKLSTLRLTVHFLSMITDTNFLKKDALNAG